MNQKHRAGGPRRTAVAWLMGALVILVAAFLVGCGGSSGDSSTEESSTANSGQAGGPAGFELSDDTRACLEEQGVDLPDPGEGPPGGGAPPEGGLPEGGPPEGGEPPQGFSQGGEEMKEALEECGAELPQGKSDGPPMDSGAFRESVKEYAACMGENGYELPEPNVSGEGPVFKESDVDREDPKFEAANEKCQSLLGGPGGGGPAEAG
jgi:hypothetical protein